MRTESFPVDGPVDLHARIGLGSFTVQAVDGLTEATVSISTRDAGSDGNAGSDAGSDADPDIIERTTIERRGSVLAVHTPRAGGRFDLAFLSNQLFGGSKRDRHAVDVTVRVPSGSPVSIGSFAGTITVEGRCGTADLATGDSEITVEHVDGDLRLRYGRATCHVVRVGGSVEARYGAGALSLGQVVGGLRLGSGAGTVEVDSVHGSVHARNGSGRISLRAVHGDVDLVTGSGDLAVGLPAGRPARLDLTTGFGTVHSRLPVVQTPLSKGEPLTVRARTGSGDITVFRAGTGEARADDAA